MQSKNFKSNFEGMNLLDDETGNIGGSPDVISGEIIRTEREIASEKLAIIKSRLERERKEWEKLLSAKEEQVLGLKKSVDDVKRRLNELKDQYYGERNAKIEEIKASLKQKESQKTADRNKWELIEDEVGKHREAFLHAQKALVEEKNRFNSLQSLYAKHEKELKGKLQDTEDEFTLLKERSLLKDEAWAKEKSLFESQINRLNEQNSSLVREIEAQRNINAALIKQKDEEITAAQKLLEESISKLREFQQSKSEIEEKYGLLENYLKDTSKNLQSIKDDIVQKHTQLQNTQQKEIIENERYKREAREKEYGILKENSEQNKQIKHAIDKLERNLAEEKRVREDIENKLKDKENELARVIRISDESIEMLKKRFSEEGRLYEKHQNELVREIQMLNQKQDNEISRLKDEIRELHVKLDLKK